MLHVMLTTSDHSKWFLIASGADGMLKGVLMATDMHISGGWAACDRHLLLWLQARAPEMICVCYGWVLLFCNMLKC